MVRIVDIRAGLYLRAHNFTITQFKYRALYMFVFVRRFSSKKYA